MPLGRSTVFYYLRINFSMQLQFSFFFEFFFAYADTVSNFSELFIYAATVFFFPELILHKYSVEGYSMEQKPTRTCSKKTHRQRHGSLVVHTQLSSSSKFSQVSTREMCTPGWVKEPRIPVSDGNPGSRQSPPLVFLRYFRVLTTGRERRRPWARPPVLSPVLRQASHSPF